MHEAFLQYASWDSDPRYHSMMETQHQYTSVKFWIEALMKLTMIH